MTATKSEVNDNLADLAVIGAREFSEFSTNGSSASAAMRDKFKVRQLEYPRHASKAALLSPARKDTMTPFHPSKVGEGRSVKVENDAAEDGEPPPLQPFWICQAAYCDTTLLDEEQHVCEFQDCSSRICMMCWEISEHRCSVHPKRMCATEDLLTQTPASQSLGWIRPKPTYGIHSRCSKQFMIADFRLNRPLSRGELCPMGLVKKCFECGKPMFE